MRRAQALQPRGWALALLLCALTAALWGGTPGAPAHAQDATPAPAAEVWVTTQDYLALRAGPSRAFDRLVTVPPAVTLRAIGRTAATDWIQVEYEGYRGWLAAWYLVWTGDVIQLPVDGVDPLAFVRRYGVVGWGCSARLYRREVTPSDEVGQMLGCRRVEIVGRLGAPGNPNGYWVQIIYEGALYWASSWEIEIVQGSVLDVLDTSYLFPYGRLLDGFERDVNASVRGLRAIQDVWGALARGGAITCANYPAYVTRTVSESDLNAEPDFRVLANAVDAANSAINASISALQDACNRTGAPLTLLEVNAQLELLAGAERDLQFAGIFLSALGRRNPLIAPMD